MKKFVRILITAIAMVAVMVLAVYARNIVNYYRDAKFEKERQVRYEEVSLVTSEYSTMIENVSHLSVNEIDEFIHEYAELDDDDDEDTSEYVDPWANTENFNYITPEYAPEDTVSGNDLDREMPDTEDGEAVDGASHGTEGSVSGNSADGENTGDSWESGDSAENVGRVASLGEEAVKNMGSVSSDDISDSASSPSPSDGEASESTDGEHKVTLKERQSFRTSSEETKLWIEADDEVLAENTEDFSNIKITCLGDSITEAANLNEEEGYEAYTYPTRLKEALGAESVTNLGIGGSSLGRFWFEPFCERYKDIPEDTDIIVVMGGTNDGYCMTEDLVGDIEKREPRTLYGDVNDLMKGLKEDYPNAEIIFMTPMPNLLHDVLRKEREGLLPQTVVVNCILELAAEYDIEVIDLYNSNFFDSHDADIVNDYIPDSVHPSKEGYEIFGRHVAAEILRLHEQKNTDDEIEELEDEKAIDKDDPEGKLLSEELDEDKKDDETKEDSEDKKKNDDPEEAVESESNTDETWAENENSENAGNDSESKASPSPSPSASPTGSKTEIYARE